MHANLAEFLEDILDGDHSVESIVRLLERDGFLSSPLSTGFTDRQVRIALIEMLGRLGDPLALPTLERHAALPNFMGNEKVAESAKRAITVLRGDAHQEPDVTFSEKAFESSVDRVTDSINAVLFGPRPPAELEAAGLRGLDLQRALYALDAVGRLPESTSDDLSVAAERVLHVTRDTGCGDEIVSEVDRLFADPEDYDSWFDVASFLRTRGCFHAALATYDQAVGRFSTEIDAMWWSNRGWLLQLWERYGDALASFERAIELNPDYERPRVGCREIKQLLKTLDSDAAETEPCAGRTPSPYEPRRLHRMAGKGGQARTHAFDLLSPANLAIGESSWENSYLDSSGDERFLEADSSPFRGLSTEHIYFISYRWETVPHREWVYRFATQLERRGYRVLFDQFEELDFRERVAPALRTDRMREEIPRMVEDLNRAAVFLPILTEGYRRCVEPVRSGAPVAGTDYLSWSLRVNPNDGWVFDEWQTALRLLLRGRLRWQAVWRDGPVVPPPFAIDRVFDFRNDGHYTKLMDTHFPHLNQNEDN